MIKQLNFAIFGMHCFSCANNIQSSLQSLKGIKKASVNFANQTAFIEYETDEISIKQIYKAIKKQGYEPTQSAFEKVQNKKYLNKIEINLFFCFFFAFVIMILAMLNNKLPQKLSAFLQFIFASFSLFFAKDLFKNGFVSFYKTKKANMDTLISLAVSAAYLYSSVITAQIIFLKANKALYFETSAFLIAFILLGRFLEAISKSKASLAMEKLMNLQPQEAIVIKNNKETKKLVTEVKKGDVLLVKPGDKIPVDGLIIEGSSSIDESMVTGESLSKEKNQNDAVIGGTINKTASFKLKATNVGKNSFLSQIIQMIQIAQRSKAPIQKLADKVSSYFVPSVLLIAFLSSIIWFVLGQNLSFCLNIFISVLIIACPCALGLATPTAIIVGTHLGAKNGILIKNAQGLQALQKANVLVFDKTATLTVGKPQITNIIPYNTNEQDILIYASSIEKLSKHPLAESITKEAENKNLKIKEVKNFKEFSGKGTKAQLDDKELLLGNKRFFEEEKIDFSFANLDIDHLMNEGKTVLLLAVNKKLLGLIAITDVLKTNAKQTVLKLQQIIPSIYMITGDNKKTAQAIGIKANIEYDHIISEVLPQDKAKYIQNMQKDKKKVAMVGDGINDAPALTQADVGIAIATGTDIAIESADIVLMKSDIMDTYKAIKLSKYIFKKIKQNLFFAFIYNTLAIPLAAGLFYPFTNFLLNPIVASIAMISSSLSVVLNSIFMKSRKF